MLVRDSAPPQPERAPATVTEPSSNSQPRARNVRDWVGYTLVVAYAAVVILSLWLRHDYAQRSARSMERAEGWGEVVRDGTHILQHLSQMYAAGVEPPTPGETRRERFEQAQDAIAGDLTKLRADLEAQATEAERMELLAEVAEMERSTAALAREIDGFLAGQGRGPGPGPGQGPSGEGRPPVSRLRLIEEKHRAAVTAHERLRERLHQMSRERLKDQSEMATRIERLDLAMHALLLTTIAATTFFLYRLARQVSADVREKSRLVQELQSSEAKYRSIFDNAVEGIFQTTPEGKFITANKALARMYGYKTPEHLMRSL